MVSYIVNTFTFRIYSNLIFSKLKHQIINCLLLKNISTKKEKIASIIIDSFLFFNQKYLQNFKYCTYYRNVYI